MPKVTSAMICSHFWTHSITQEFGWFQNIELSQTILSDLVLLAIQTAILETIQFQPETDPFLWIGTIGNTNYERHYYQIQNQSLLGHSGNTYI